MNLRQYAKSINQEIKGAKSVDEVSKIIYRAQNILVINGYSKKQIEEFNAYIVGEASLLIKEAQENQQTLDNQKKAIELLKKD